VSLALAALLVTAAAAPAPGVLAVRLTTIDFRPAVRLLTVEPTPSAAVVREGDEVVVQVSAEAVDPLPLPRVEAPLEGIRVERAAGSTAVRIKVAPEIPFVVGSEPGLLTVIFGEPPSPEDRGPVTPDLYKRLFPSGGVGAGAEGEGEALPEARTEGLAVGRVSLRPYVTASWVDADVLAFDNPTPVRDQYLQVAPGVTASMPLFDGTLAAEYEPRLRFFSQIPQVGETSHFAGVKLELPVGSRTFLRIGHRYTSALLETAVVDPGHEYFYDLSRYHFNATSLLARVDIGPRLFAEGEAGWSWARFDESTTNGFFDYDSRALRAGLGYDLGSDLRAVVSYAYEHIPPSPDREIVETTAHDLTGTFTGQIAPLTKGSVSVGLRHQTSPLATGDSRSFTGVTLGGTLTRELGQGSTAGLEFTRTTDPSGFDQNAYYVNNSVVASLTVNAPFQTWARGSVGWLRNGYPNETAEIGAPRRDEILAWTVGLGRQLGWRAWVRADYRRERRDSNVPGYDVTTDGFVLQLGLGLFGPAGTARP
jgi:hypothetical protein